MRREAGKDILDDQKKEKKKEYIKFIRICEREQLVGHLSFGIRIRFFFLF